ncbi:uncharacterized protein K02A2.6-like [Leptopilina boulardi]|uniref:uncharacterized protein K02A2.6-like n=1 Tax=Leptopilina boulardi TaxID=63433 RepID=UPI0021F512A2|nr:uncharacterized protein K02A2.6-like [Leptopilina boulardi]
MDSEIEDITKSCKWCLEGGGNPPKTLLNVWKWPKGPGYRLHADFCGPINGFMYLVIVDAYSKWLDVREMISITAEQTIIELKEYFSVWGLPHKLVTDNGPTFTSELFERFLKNNKILHIRTAPYHPALNGAAENGVGTFKAKFKLLLKQGLSRHDALCKFLFFYRATPHCTTNLSPAELQIGRQLRARFDAIKPIFRETNELREKVECKQAKQMHYFRGNRKIAFNQGDVVMIKVIETIIGVEQKSLSN